MSTGVVHHSFAHPAAYYARYFVLVADDASLQATNNALAGFGIAEMNAEQHARVVRDMSSHPADFRPWDATHSPSTRWLRDRRIFTLVHQDEAVRDMGVILSNARLREAVERMLLGRVHHAQVAYRLRDLGWTVSEQAVADYRHYFWNTEELGVGDWAHYFRTDVRGRTRDVQEGYDAVLHAGPQLAMYRSGVRTEVDRKKAMLDMCTEIVFTFEEVRAQPTSPKKVEMLASLARSFARVDERLEAGDSALQDVLKKFEKFSVIVDGAKTPSMLELAPTGSFSNGDQRKTSPKEK